MHAFETLGVVSLNEIRAVTPTYQRAGSLVSHLANPKLLSWDRSRTNYITLSFAQICKQVYTYKT